MIMITIIIIILIFFIKQRYLDVVVVWNEMKCLVCLVSQWSKASTWYLPIEGITIDIWTGESESGKEIVNGQSFFPIEIWKKFIVFFIYQQKNARTRIRTSIFFLLLSWPTWSLLPDDDDHHHNYLIVACFLFSVVILHFTSKI